MLVLTRKVGETLVIGGNIRVVVVAIKGEKIRLGIEARTAVRVDRQEVHAARSSFAEELECGPITKPVLDRQERCCTGQLCGT